MSNNTRVVPCCTAFAVLATDSTNSDCPCGNGTRSKSLMKRFPVTTTSATFFTMGWPATRIVAVMGRENGATPFGIPTWSFSATCAFDLVDERRQSVENLGVASCTSCLVNLRGRS